MVTPYTDTVAWQTSSKRIFVRVFDKDVNEDRLEWHTDQFDRTVQVIKGNNWQLQYDNQLPEPFVHNKIYLIDSGTHHRIIKGTDDLVLLIIEKIIN